MDHVQLLSLLLPLLAAGTLLVRVGQAFAAVGAARSKDAASAVARNLFDLAVGVLAFGLVGIHLMIHGDSSRIIGGQSDVSVEFHALNLHFTSLVLIASGIIAPAVAERSKRIVPLVGCLLVSLILFPVLGHSVWYGWLARAGLIDVAGAVPLHLAGALCAIVAAYCVGPRTGKYNHDGSTNIIPGHQAAFPALGTLFMLAGWLPYVMGSALLREVDSGTSAVARAAVNALVAAAAGGVGSSMMFRFRSGRDNLTTLSGGLLAGAIAMTAACGSIASWQAAVLGLIAGLLNPVVGQWLDFKCRIDDPGSTTSPHLIGALVASLGAAAFSPQNLAGRFQSLGVQCVGVGSIALVSILFSWIVFAALGQFVKIRVKEGDEYDGLDLAQHDVNAYPDFQQTTIKSYHTREA
jgi:ammonium transporter, Amt family